MIIYFILEDINDSRVHLEVVLVLAKEMLVEFFLKIFIPGVDENEKSDPTVY